MKLFRLFMGKGLCQNKILIQPFWGCVIATPSAMADNAFFDNYAGWMASLGQT